MPNPMGACVNRSSSMRSERGTAGWSLVLTLVACMVTACSDSDPSNLNSDAESSELARQATGIYEENKIPEADYLLRLTYDFGSVKIETADQQVDHKFSLVNRLDEHVDVTRVKTSCGCVQSKLSTRTLRPGETIDITLTMKLENNGQITHGATVIFSNGGLATLNLSAFGDSGATASAILESPHPDAVLRTLPLRIYMVDTTGSGMQVAPLILEPETVSLEADPWIVIEQSGQKQLRPTRQIANCTLDFSDYCGHWPVDVRIQLDRLMTVSVRVLEPSSE
jgi:hypothetical protein